MNKINNLITLAARDGQEIKLCNREVNASGNKIRIKLHGEDCIIIDKDVGTVYVDGNTPRTRQSCRLINNVLDHCTTGKVLTRLGQWYYQPIKGRYIPFDGTSLSLPLTKEFNTQTP